MKERTADEYLEKIIDLSEEMIELASAGDACRTDNGCGIVFGALRDKAYKLRKLAHHELRLHRQGDERSGDERLGDERGQHHGKQQPRSQETE